MLSVHVYRVGSLTKFRMGTPATRDVRKHPIAGMEAFVQILRYTSGPAGRHPKSHW